MNMTPERPLIFVNPTIRWAVHTAHQHQLRQIDGIAGAQKEPTVGDVMTLDFIVDAASGLPCPVRVTQLLYAQEPDRTLIIPVVEKHQPE